MRAIVFGVGGLIYLPVVLFGYLATKGETGPRLLRESAEEYICT